MTDTREFCPICNQPKHFVSVGKFVCPSHPSEPPKVEDEPRVPLRKPRHRPLAS